MLVDQTYYETTFGGASFDASLFLALSAKSERNIQTITGHKVDDFTTLTGANLERVKEAVCMQVEYLYTNGKNADTSQLSGFSIGSFSVSGTATKKGVQYPDAIDDVLYPTGLLFGGVDVW